MRWLIVSLVIGVVGIAAWLQFGGLLKGRDLGEIERGVKDVLDEKALKDETIRNLSIDIAKKVKEAQEAQARARAAEARASELATLAADLLGRVGDLERERAARPAVKSLDEAREELARRLSP